MEQTSFPDPRRDPWLSRQRGMGTRDMAKVLPSSHPSCFRSLWPSGHLALGFWGHGWEAGWSYFNQILPITYLSALSCHLGFFL